MGYCANLIELFHASPRLTTTASYQIGSQGGDLATHVTQQNTIFKCEAEFLSTGVTYIHRDLYVYTKISMPTSRNKWLTVLETWFQLDCQALAVTGENEQRFSY